MVTKIFIILLGLVTIATSSEIFPTLEYLSSLQTYNGDRKEIMPLARQIQTLIKAKHTKEEFYENLVNQMMELGQFPGKEIFELGVHIEIDMGANSKAFLQLPQVVQQICTGGPLRLIYRDTTSQDFPMNMVRASTSHDMTLHYNISSREMAGEIQWAITYGRNPVYSHRLEIPFGDLKTTLSSIEYFRFTFHLHQDLETFAIYTVDNGFGYTAPLEAVFNVFTQDYSFRTRDNNHTNTTAFYTTTYEMNVDKMYGGIRKNIIKLIRYIHNSSDFVDQQTAYTDLFSAMEKYDQVEGQGIFELGEYISEDLGSDSLLFNSLPAPVKLVALRNAGKLIYRREPMNENEWDPTDFPLKYAWASHLHENVLPFKFDYDKIRSTFALTYADDFQLEVTDTRYGKLIEKRNVDQKRYQFHLYLGKVVDSISIRCWHLISDGGGRFLSNPLQTNNTSPDFYFHCNQDVETDELFYLRLY